MEELSVENVVIKNRLPLLKYKEIYFTHIKPAVEPISAFLTDEILTNLQYCTDALVCSHEGKVSNVWSSAIRREKFKHISDNPICICGAGNDLTFLYDKLPKEIIGNYSNPLNNSDKSKKRSKKTEDKMIMRLPEKLVPAEFTLSTHHGVRPIQLYDENFTTKPFPHKSHKIALPIMNPNNISNSNKVYQSFADILDKIGLNEPFEFNMPTVLHNLLMIVKKEQDLYNVVFHEVIKETTVDCIERGELLANIRQRYRNLFFNVPVKIKEFHDKVVARKILDRRLTEELLRFQNTVSMLSKELSGVKDHEENINQICKQAKLQLKEAVEETKTNADLLREYHDLYEQQRQRLEKTVFQLEKERDCWRNAAYKITQLVLENYDIQPAIVLVECESNMISLSRHFVDLLTVTDNHALVTIKTKTTQWCNEAQKFSLMLAIREENLKNFLNREIEKINRMKEDFEYDFLNEQGQLIKPINKEETLKILNSVINWEKAMSEICESFGGQSMLIEEEKLKQMKQICFEYTDIAVEVFNRHRNETDGSLYQEHVALLDINKLIDEMMGQFMDQLTGDNGVADGIIALQTYEENWITRLSNSVADLYFRPLPDSEWIRFKLLLDDWIVLLHESKNAIGTNKYKLNSVESASINKRLEIHEIIQSVDSWSQKSSSGIESENLKLQEAIINLKKSMIRWTSQIILRLAPDFPTNSPEAKRAARLASLGIRELQETAKVLHENITAVSNHIFNCSKDIVTRLMQIKIDTQTEFPDRDSSKLHQLIDFSKSWIEKSEVLLKEIIESEYESQNKMSSEKDSTEMTFAKEPSTVDKEEPIEENQMEDYDASILIGNLLQNVISATSDLFDPEYENEEEDKFIEVPIPPPTVEGIGIDFNVHSKMLIQNPNEPYSGNKFQNTERVDAPNDLPKTEEAYQLIKIFENLQKRLRSLTLEALAVEDEYVKKELENEKSKGYLKSLEEIYEKRVIELEQLQNEKKQILPIPTLFQATNTIERAISLSTNRSTTPKSVTSSKHRAPPHSKRIIKK